MTFFVHLMMLVASGDFGAHAFSATLSRQSHQGFGRRTSQYAGRPEKAIIDSVVTAPSGESKRISFVSSLVTAIDADGNEVGDDNCDGINDNDDDGDDDVGAAVPDASPELRALLLARNAQFLAGLRLRKEAIDTVLRCMAMDSIGRVSFPLSPPLASLQRPAHGGVGRGGPLAAAAGQHRHDPRYPQTIRHTGEGGRRAPAHRQCHRPAPMHAFHTRLRALTTSPHTQYPTLAVDILVKPVKVLDLLFLPLL